MAGNDCAQLVLSARAPGACLVAQALQSVSARAQRNVERKAHRMPKTHAHDLGLGHDLLTLRKRELSRRTLLRWSALSGLGLVGLAGCPKDSDNVFRDGAASQLASMSGSVSAGYQAQLTVGVSLK